MICPKRGIPASKDSRQVGFICTTLRAKCSLKSLAPPKRTCSKHAWVFLTSSQKRSGGVFWSRLIWWRQFKRHRFPPQIIGHAMWHYLRYPPSLRLVEGSALLECWVFSRQSIKNSKERQAVRRTCLIAAPGGQSLLRAEPNERACRAFPHGLLILLGNGAGLIVERGSLPIPLCRAAGDPAGSSPRNNLKAKIFERLEACDA